MDTFPEAADDADNIWTKIITSVIKTAHPKLVDIITDRAEEFLTGDGSSYQNNAELVGNAAIAVANSIEQIMYMDFTSSRNNTSNHNMINFDKLMTIAAPHCLTE